jgi:predicted phage terminase large subunit-like protein
MPASNRDIEIWVEVLRKDFFTFFRKAFAELNPGTKFIPGGPAELISAKLESVYRYETKNLIINIPPRYLKSQLVSVAFTAWWLGNRPSDEIMCISYSQDLADKFSRDCRAIMQTPWYRAVFPGAALSPVRRAVAEFRTRQHGGRYATSVGGVVTGRGAHLIVVDDPIKPDDAMSDKVRNNVNDWIPNTLLSRLNDKQNGAMVLIMQRVHEDDPTGYLLKQGGWEVLRLPAIALEVEAIPFRTIGGERCFTRKQGEALHPARESLESLLELKRRMGDWIFDCQYQQAPAPIGGDMVKEEWLRYYGSEDLPGSFDGTFQSWDTGIKPSELSSYSVCTTWGAKGDHLYLLDVRRERLNYSELKLGVSEQARRFAAKTILIEEKASGYQLIEELKGSLPGITAIQPEGDKKTRLFVQASYIATGFLHVPREAPWLHTYRDELLRFPNTSHSDQVDSTSQAIKWWREREGRIPGITRYYDRLLAERRNGAA